MHRPVATFGARGETPDNCLKAAIGAPMGRRDSASSSITGAPLTYFTPDSLSDLLARYQIAPYQRSYEFGSQDPSHCLILVRLASLSSGKIVDVAQARRLAGLCLQPVEWTSTEQLIGFARSLSPKVKGLREEISFVGGATASHATHIFAPASVLPALVEEFSETVLSGNQQIDAAVLAAMVGFCAVHAHPFVDGNGRWSRAMAMYAGMRSDLRASISAVVFLSAENQLLCERVWPNARSFGAEKYFAALYRFEHELFARLDAATKLVELLNEINAVVSTAARESSRLRGALMMQLYSDGRLALTDFQARCGLSTRVTARVAQRLREAGLLAVRSGAEWIDMTGPLELAADAVSAAGAAAREEIQKGMSNEV